MAGSPPNLHTMDSRSACIQGVLKDKVKVKGHVIRALSWILGMSYSVIDGLVKSNNIVFLIESAVISDTRETSFLYAIVGAGAVQAVAEGCSHGRLLSCSCGNTDALRTPPLRRPPPGGSPSYPGSVADNAVSSGTAGDWTWAGCMDDVAFAYVKSKQFIDVEPDTGRGSDFRTMLQSHNYEAGRLVSLFHSLITV